MEKHQLISHLLLEFPEFRSRCAENSERLGHDAGPYTDLSLFVDFLTDELYEKGNYKQVKTVFEQMEEFLRDGSGEVRELVARGFLETLRTVASWKPYGSDAFLQFLYPESRRVWLRLDAAWNLNLDDYGVLEKEVLVWRVVQQSLSYPNLIAQ